MKRTRSQRLSHWWSQLPDPARLMVLLAGVIALALFVPGCASALAVVPPRVVVPVECREPMPERPAMPTDSLTPDATVDQYVAAAEAEIARREGYEDQLRTALESCRKPLKP